MKFSDWFRRKSPLQLALQRGVEKGNLADEIHELGDVIVKSRHDAEAICDVLAAIARGEVAHGDGFKSALRVIAGLFQEIESAECDACPVLASRGTPLLQQAVERALASADEERTDDVLFALKILAMFGTREGADLIIRLARRGFRSEDWLWNVILGAFRGDHPQANYVFSSLSSPLPAGFIAVSLLDGANRFFMEGGEGRHPCDSDEGVARLRAWLTDSNEEHFSYATSAVAALPFIDHPNRSKLLETATRHSSPDVRLEGAWAAAKLDEESGFAALASMCLDVNLARRASEYLRELKRPDVIPAEASAPDFMARAEFAQWLAHPNELGRPPDELEIRDHRTMRWPPDFAERPVWLLRYVVHNKNGLDPDDIGVGMVGPSTWCFFSYDMEQRPPDDCYALHCFWEMERERIAMHDVEANSVEYNAMLSQWTGTTLEGVRIEHVAELETELRHPQKLVAVAGGKRSGNTGWVVLDGSDSRWYSADEFPGEERGKTILKIHIGRCLLRLPLDADRKKWLRPPAAVPDKQVIAAYEKILSECLSVSENEQATLLASASSPLSKHFENYVNAVVHVRNQARASVVASTYEAILARVMTSTAVTSEKALDSFTPVGERLNDYAAALIELGRGLDAMALVRKLLPLWQHNLGYGRLGAIAFKAGDHALAEELLLKLKTNLKDWPRVEEMTHLAEIWQHRGNTKEARELMLAGLRHTLDEAAEATGSDIQYHERIYQRQRLDFERIFGDSTSLTALGLPDSTPKPRSVSA
jgi:hypothetical protein